MKNISSFASYFLTSPSYSLRSRIQHHSRRPGTFREKLPQTVAVHSIQLEVEVSQRSRPRALACGLWMEDGIPPWQRGVGKKAHTSIRPAISWSCYLRRPIQRGIHLQPERGLGRSTPVGGKIPCPPCHSLGDRLLKRRLSRRLLLLPVCGVGRGRILSLRLLPGLRTLLLLSQLSLRWESFSRSLASWCLLCCQKLTILHSSEAQALNPSLHDWSLPGRRFGACSYSQRQGMPGKGRVRRGRGGEE